MSASFLSDPVAQPPHVPLPGAPTIVFRIGSSLASEPVTIHYDLDAAGTVTFANGGFQLVANAVATAGGTPVNQPVGLRGAALTGTIEIIVITMTGADHVPQVAPAFVIID